MNKTLPDPRYPEIPMFGMNNYDSDKTMVSDSYRGFYRQLTNTYPGPSQKPRKGMNDVSYSLAMLGFNTTQTIFKRN